MKNSIIKPISSLTKLFIDKIGDEDLIFNKDDLDIIANISIYYHNTHVSVVMDAGTTERKDTHRFEIKIDNAAIKKEIQTKKQLSLYELLIKVCTHFGVSITELYSNSKVRKLANVRKIFILKARDMGYSIKEIAIAIKLTYSYVRSIYKEKENVYEDIIIIYNNLKLL